MIAIIRASREDSKEALTFLKEALETYEKAINLCKSATPAEEFKLELSSIDRFLLKPSAPDADMFERRIYGGINVKVLEQNLTQTYFYLAQVYQ